MVCVGIGGFKSLRVLGFRDPAVLHQDRWKSCKEQRS